jgi:hypothetical protein
LFFDFFNNKEKGRDHLISELKGINMNIVDIMLELSGITPMSHKSSKSIARKA